MIRNIHRNYFEVWGSEEAQNAFLKGILCIVSILFLVQSIALVVVSLRRPTLIAIGKSETKVLTFTPPAETQLNDELKRVVKNYIETHYNWDSSTVDKAHEQAAHYVSEKLIKAFNTANAEQIKIAKEKRVSQRVYLSSEILVDTKALTARASTDRILTIEGLRAASPFILDITFEYGSRTQENPEGIYITGEKVISSQGG